MGNQQSHCPDGGVSYPPSMRKVEVLSLHGQTCQVYTQARPPVATASTFPTTDDVISATELLKQTRLHDHTNTQAESSVATTSTTTATDAVLTTTELLEQILSYFDIKNLLLLRRVSRHWSDVMAESLVLQRIMFLAPEPELPFKWHLGRTRYDRPHHYTKNQSGTVSELEPDTEPYESSRFNALLFERRPNTVTGNTDDMYYPFLSLRLYPRLPLKDVGANKLFSRMLIAQPPVTYAHMGCNATVLNKKGIRLKDVVYAIRVENDYVCELGHGFSFVVPRVMFPTREQGVQQTNNPI